MSTVRKIQIIKNYNQIVYIYWMAEIKKGRQTISISEETQKVESTGDKVKLYSCFGKQSGSPSVSHL